MTRTIQSPCLTVSAAEPVPAENCGRATFARLVDGARKSVPGVGSRQRACAFAAARKLTSAPQRLMIMRCCQGCPTVLHEMQAPPRPAVHKKFLTKRRSCTCREKCHRRHEGSLRNPGKDPRRLAYTSNTKIDVAFQDSVSRFAQCPCQRALWRPSP